MQGQGFTKKDWMFFRNKIADWQETYMDMLNKEYIEISIRIMGELILVRPNDLYEEQVMSYREERLKNGDGFDGCAGLENVQSFSERIDFERRL